MCVGTSACVVGNGGVSCGTGESVFDRVTRGRPCVLWYGRSFFSFMQFGGATFAIILPMIAVAIHSRAG